MEKLGEPASAAYRAAGKLSTAYVFPSSAQEFDVLRAALHENPEDGTAHYLLGTLFFSRGLTEDALAEWNAARKFAPGLPVLHASLGRVLLQVKNDPEQALAAFREGLRNDPTNAALYVGIDQTLSLLKRSARERVDALQLYPDRENMPTRLIYELILNLAEAGEYDAATALFHNRFFAREEGGTNVRQVWIEVQLQRALGLAHGGRCNEALSAVEQLPSQVPGLPFTQDGLEPILRLARTNYLAGEVYGSCSEGTKAKSRFETAAAQVNPDQIVWAYRSARKLAGFDQRQWQPQLESALTRNFGQTSWGFYNRGMIDDALGHSGDAEADFHRALLMPDGLLAYHLTRLALAQQAP
jgi:tetratricopeptide (TPR) repeat protein